MTSAVPGVIAWPVMVALALVIAGRFKLLNATPIDKLINQAMIAGYSGLLLREAWFEYLVASVLPFEQDNVIQIMRQLSFGSIVWSIMGVYGIVKLWGGADPAGTWRRQRVYYTLAAVATVVILIAGTPARHAHQLIDQYMGWPAVLAWVAFYLPIGAAALLLMRVAYGELRSADATGRERTLYAAILVGGGIIFLDAVATPIVTALEVLNDEPSRNPNMSTKSWIFFLATCGSGAAVALPLISTLLTSTGWDRTGRYCRRLRPLWRDVTAAVPEIVLEMPRDQAGHVAPATRLHRYMIEIRDSLVQLKRYSSTPASFADPDPKAFARNIAAALDAKAAGNPPAVVVSAATPLLGARDLTGELEQLLALSKAWRRTPRAHHIHGGPAQFSGADPVR
ncbi:hypothetical protein IU501_32760 [Nocardia otitidiscaviarum]|uniref:MAB_1171c family putative transporter n=1 Tax=Nocardia otitidiscaviarum TaxID=1823 RepID=UPI0004A71956|nr:MAB_1171c family putative transporter [Nocardia otitidiscaviarum]MBF6137743.1 hypothetical protein [Nocardia otitidiscaviarum]MBF6485264.1 hypothetical protein [Nocardia otitidiscaviarum]